MTKTLDPLDAGRFATWLRAFRAAVKNGRSIAVPCGDCTACCTSKRFVHIEAGETKTLAAVPKELAFPAPGAPTGTVVLGYDAKGRCPLFHEGGCGIYRQRPLTCRTFDCRVLAAAGLAGDHDAIHRQARRWAFTYASEHDARLHAAVTAAARELHRQNARADAVQLAVRAVMEADPRVQ